MNPKTFVNRFILLSVFIGIILGVYVAAKAQTTGNRQLGSQIVAKGDGTGAMTPARCHCNDRASGR